MKMEGELSLRDLDVILRIIEEHLEATYLEDYQISAMLKDIKEDICDYETGNREG